MIFWSNISQMGLSSAAEPAAAVVATSCSHSSSCTGVGDSGQSVSKPQGPTDGVETTARTSGTQNDTNKMICKTQQNPAKPMVSQGSFARKSSTTAGFCIPTRLSCFIVRYSFLVLNCFFQQCGSSQVPNDAAAWGI